MTRERRDPHYSPGKIRGVNHYFEDRIGQMSSYIYIDYDDGGTQGFGGIALGPKDGKFEKAWVRELCLHFEVSKLEELVGLKCHVLRCWDEWNTTIDGIEAPNGSRFTIRGFLKRNLKDYQETSAFADKAESIQREISFLERRIAEERTRMRNMRKKYKAWDEPDTRGPIDE